MQAITETRLVKYRGLWAVYWHEDGQSKRRSLGTPDRLEALRLKEAFDRLQVEKKPELSTIAGLWGKYREHLAGRPAATTMMYEGKAILSYFGTLAPTEIDKSVVETYIAQRRAAGRKDGTILTELNRLAGTLNYAFRNGWIERVPMIPRPHAPPPKDRYLTKDEAAIFVPALGRPHLRLFATLALTTAARAAALLELTWDRVDFNRRLIYLADPEVRRRSKGRAVVPMTPTAENALSEARERAIGPFVIEYAGRPVKSVKKGMELACERSGIADVTPHVFRHTAAVWMAEAGVPMSEISQYLGHTSTAVTERVYARYSPGYLRGAASALDF